MSRRVRTPIPRRARTLVWAATSLVAAVAAAWSVVLPIGEGPDEPAHLGLVLHLADGNGYPDHDALHRTVALERLCETFVAATRVCPLPGEPVSATSVRVRRAEDAPARADRPSFDDEGGALAVTEINQMPQHPPLYYGSMAVALRSARAVVGGPMALDRELALLRLLNVILVIPVPALAWLTARRLGADDRMAVAAALMVAGQPMLAATSGLLNNDNLLMLLGAAAAPMLAALAMGDRRRRTAASVGVVVGLALLTKAFAVVLLPTIVLACWVGSGRTDGDRAVMSRIRRSAVPAGVAAVAVALVAGWWYLRTWWRAGSPTPSVDADRYTEALRPPGFSPDIVRFADEFAGRFAERFWGSFGWYSARLPGWLTVALTITAAVLVVTGIVRAGPRRPPLLVLAVPAALLVLLTASRAWTLHERSGQYPFIQGRYLLAGCVGLAVLAAGGWVALVTGRRSTALLAALVVSLQVVALARGLTAYWSGGPIERVRAIDAWSGLPGGSAFLLVAGAAVAAVLVLVAGIAYGGGYDGEGDDGDGPGVDLDGPSPGADPVATASPVPSASR